jgi:hypothetical protein
VVKPDYAKWMLEDPRVNFAISARGAEPGLRHLGIQAESEIELKEVYGRLQAAGRPVLEEGKTTCCYAQSEKSWVGDPAGIAWETFYTSGESTSYGSPKPTSTESARAEAAQTAAACGCKPKAATASPEAQCCVS